jgi:pimeloyl-ACP methyl ester carboxylesterase
MLSTGDIVADLTNLPAGLPIQVIAGEADVITPPAVNLEIAAACQAVSTHVIPGAGPALYPEKAAAIQSTTDRRRRGTCGSIAEGTVARRRDVLSHPHLPATW